MYNCMIQSAAHENFARGIELETEGKLIASSAAFREAMVRFEHNGDDYMSAVTRSAMDRVWRAQNE